MCLFTFEFETYVSKNRFKDFIRTFWQAKLEVGLKTNNLIQRFLTQPLKDRDNQPEMSIEFEPNIFEV